jgi:hypothetical protein
MPRPSPSKYLQVLRMRNDQPAGKWVTERVAKGLGTSVLQVGFASRSPCSWRHRLMNSSYERKAPVSLSSSLVYRVRTVLFYTMPISPSFRARPSTESRLTIRKSDEHIDRLITVSTHAPREIGCNEQKQAVEASMRRLIAVDFQSLVAVMEQGKPTLSSPHSKY